MANYSVLKAAVQAVVKTNGNQEITGANMQSTLISIINSLGTGYQFMGVATPSTSPGTPDYNVAYIGGAGTYANFGTSVTVPVGSIGVFKYNGSWAKEQIVVMDKTFIDKVEYSTEQTRNLVREAERVEDYYLNSSGRYVKESGSMSFIFPCNPSTTYTISKIVTTRFRVAYFTQYPVNNDYGQGTITSYAATSITITTGADAAYIVGWIYNSTGETSTMDAVWASLQIEIGSTATAYITPFTAKDMDARGGVSALSSEIDSLTPIIESNKQKVEKLEKDVYSSNYGLTTDDIITGYYRNYIGTLSGLSGYFYSNPIKIYQGDKVIITDGNIATNVSAISIVDASNNFISAVYCGEGQTASYTFTAYEDMYVSLSAPVNKLSVFQIQSKGVINRLSDNVELTSELSVSILGTNMTLKPSDVINGYYRNINGVLVELSSYFYTKPIKVHIGDKVTTSSAAQFLTNISVISEVNEENEYISTLKAGTGDSAIYNYTLQKDCYISICALKNSVDLFVIQLNGIDERITMIDSTISLGADNLPLINDNPLAQIRREQGYGSIIRTWGIVGDSLSSGEMQCYNNTSTDATDYKFIDMYQYSWGQVFARLIGATAYNYSSGGQTAWSWIKGNTQPHDETYIGGVGGGGWNYAQQAGQEKDAYIIALGVNDRKKIEDGDYTLGSTSQITTYDGTDSDIDDTTTYPKSYVRYYAGIIQRLLSIQPKAKIFCVTPLGGAYSEIAQAIRDVVAYFGGNVYLVDMVTYIPEGYKVTGFMLNGHLSPLGYAYIGYLMNTYIDWIIRKNGAAFIDTALIGTDYRPSF